MASVADTDPPGLLMYMWMSEDLFSYWRNKSLWMTMLASRSVMTGLARSWPAPRNTIRFSISRSPSVIIRWRAYWPRWRTGSNGCAAAIGSNGSMGYSVKMTKAPPVPHQRRRKNQDEDSSLVVGGAPVGRSSLVLSAGGQL